MLNGIKLACTQRMLKSSYKEIASMHIYAIAVVQAGLETARKVLQAVNDKLFEKINELI